MLFLFWKILAYFVLFIAGYCLVENIHAYLENEPKYGRIIVPAIFGLAYLWALYYAGVR